MLSPSEITTMFCLFCSPSLKLRLFTRNWIFFKVAGYPIAQENSCCQLSDAAHAQPNGNSSGVCVKLWAWRHRAFDARLKGGSLVTWGNTAAFEDDTLPNQEQLVLDGSVATCDHPRNHRGWSMRSPEWSHWGVTKRSLSMKPWVSSSPDWVQNGKDRFGQSGALWRRFSVLIPWCDSFQSFWSHSTGLRRHHGFLRLLHGVRSPVTDCSSDSQWWCNRVSFNAE
jgi:hypothetical protein